LPRASSRASVYSPTNGWSANLGQNGYRLPTEIEWRKAAAWSAGAWLAYGTGSNTLVAGAANYLNSGDAFEGQAVRTCPAGSFAPSSPYGLKDASGNVWEWCQDGYEGPATNAAAARAARGGGWGNLPQDLQTGVRSGFKPGQALDSVGFRILSGAATAE